MVYMFKVGCKHDFKMIPDFNLTWEMHAVHPTPNIREYLKIRTSPCDI